MANQLYLALTLALALASTAYGKVPAVFYFGDSIFDTGNNLYIPNTQINFHWYPYGSTYFNTPSGRFSNGRVIPDLIWQKLKFPGLPPPILQPGANFSYGANFASGGATCLDFYDPKGQYLNLKTQLELFKNLTHVKNSSAPSDEAYKKALYALNIGGNDVLPYIVTNLHEQIPLDNFATLFANTTVGFLKELYKLGARKLWSNMLPALNCSPFIRNTFAWNSTKCVTQATTIVKSVNEAIAKSIEDLRKELPDAIILLSNPHAIIKSSEDPEPYGFLVGNSACCGRGFSNGDQNAICGIPGGNTTVCADPEQYVFWDYLHGTERTYRSYADRIWSGPKTDIHPTNLHTLVNLELPTGHIASKGSSKHGKTCDARLDSSCQ